MLVFPPDITLVIQLVSFFGLFFVLNKLLFAPFAELLAEREGRTEGAEDSADDARARAEELRQQIDAEISEARAAAIADAEGLRRKTRDEEAAIYDAAKREAADELAGLRAGIDRERAEASAILQSEARGLADEMVRAVLQ